MVDFRTRMKNPQYLEKENVAANLFSINSASYAAVEKPGNTRQILQKMQIIIVNITLTKKHLKK